MPSLQILLVPSQVPFHFGEAVFVVAQAVRLVRVDDQLRWHFHILIQGTVEHSAMAGWAADVVLADVDQGGRRNVA